MLSQFSENKKQFSIRHSPEQFLKIARLAKVNFDFNHFPYEVDNDVNEIYLKSLKTIKYVKKKHLMEKKK